MDAPAVHDEVVSDSEDEESMNMNLDVSPVQTTFPDTTNISKPFGLSDINSFTDKASAPSTFVLPSSFSSHDRPSSPLRPVPHDMISNASSSGRPPRPKPRPAYKKKKDRQDKPEAIDIFSNDPPQVQTVGTSDISQFQTDIPSSIADRAKMRSRKTKSNSYAMYGISPKGQDSNRTAPHDVIELSSDEDELILLPSKTKSEGKRKLHTTNKLNGFSESPLSSASEFDPVPRPKPKTQANKRRKSSHPMSPQAQSPQGTILLPTSSSTDPIAPIPFNLLPSQLPPSDPPMSTATTCDVPPIETLPNCDTDPLSSPPSLFTPPSWARKRRQLTFGADQLDSDNSQSVGIEKDTDIQRMPPPPLPKPLLKARKKSTESMSLSILPPTTDSSVTSVGTVKKSQTVKLRRKKRQVDGESGEVGTKGKGKGQKKVEVVIQVPKSKAQSKGKEKEVFKSREFIEEDDEEVMAVEASSRITSPLNKPNSMTSLSSVPDSDEEGIPMEPSKRQKPSGDRGLHSSENKIPMGAKRVTRKAKRQSKIVSEDENEGLVTGSLLEASPDRPPSVDKRKRSPAKVHGRTPGAQSGSKNRTRDSDDIDNNAKEVALKENIQAMPSPSANTTKPSESLFPSLSSRYTIAPKAKPTPMSDLIRRVNSLPGSPFPTPPSRVSRLSIAGTAYSPYLKSSRSMLSRIAPLHPNRRTPPPPLPPPPPPKKTKKEREREDQWEEELIESVGGIAEWACMTDTERKELRKLKQQREMAGWEE